MPVSSERPVRVLMVTGPAAGGLKRHVERLAVGLPAFGVAVAAAAPGQNAFEIEPSFPFELGDRPRPLADLRSLQQLRRAVAAWQPDLIHAHGAKAAIMGLLAFPSGRPRVMVTYHNRWLGGPLTLPLRLLAPRACASIAVSEAVRKSLLEQGIQPAALRVIRNGIDPDAFYPAPDSHPERPFTFLFLGRLTEEKGIPLLLEVAGKLEGHTHLRILVAGDGPLRPRVEAQAALRHPILQYLGPQEDVLPLFHRADAVVMPSLSEGLPMTALEGMACGLPLIASPVGGIPELVADGVTGILVDGRDPAIWVRSLTELASDRPRARLLGLAGRKRVESEFSEQVMFRELSRLYCSALP